MEEVDLFVIGAGSGGVRAARVSAALGARVAVAEERHLGGTCVNVGCVPKKLFSYAAHYHEDFEDARNYGWEATHPQFRWETLLANKNREIQRLNGVYRRMLEAAGVTLVEGSARVADAHTVEVDGRRFRAGRILVATGSAATVPAVPGAEHVVTSDQAFHLPRLPRRVLVVGGGYIAVEFASIFNGLGVQTVLSYRGGHLLRGFDDDVRAFVTEEMRRKGIEVMLASQVGAVRRESDGQLTACFADACEREADLIMYATGRAPRSRGFGLEQIGVAMAENGAIRVDDEFRTSVDSVYGLGDVIDRIKLTPVATAEAMVVAHNLFGSGGRRMDYDDVPTAVFCHPNVACVGLTEAQARSRHGEVDVYASSFRALKHTLSGREERTFMKLVVEPASGRVLGVHMVGAEAGEIVQGFAVALRCGATKAQFDATIGIHPTVAEEFVTMREKVSGSIRRGD